MNSNKDCRKCALSTYFDDGGGDYEDMKYRCVKYDTDVTYTSIKNKPCELEEGKYYIATYSINNI